MDAFIKPDWIPINFSDISNKSLSCAKQGQKDLKGHTNGEEHRQKKKVMTDMASVPPHQTPHHYKTKKSFIFTLSLIGLIGVF